MNYTRNVESLEVEEFIAFFFPVLFLKCCALAVAIALVSERLNSTVRFNNASANNNEAVIDVEEAVIDVEYEVVDIAAAPRATTPRPENTRRPSFNGRKCQAHVSWAESLSILRSAC